MTKKEDKLITVKTLAEMTGLSTQTIYLGQADTHQLSKVKLGRSVRFSYLEVVDWIEKKKAEAAAPPQTPVRLRLITKPALDRKTIARIINPKKK